MRLVSISVTNFRSITTAHRLHLYNSTILIGQNNEGKSNVLHALAIGLELIKQHATRVRSPRLRRNFYRGERTETEYDWERDFPIQLQETKPNGKSIFRLEFELSQEEVAEFKREIKSNLNGTLPIEIKIGVDRKPEFNVIKKGPGGTTLSKKAQRIAGFIGEKCDLTYIPAVRTSEAAIHVVDEMLDEELVVLEEDEEYRQALQKIKELQEPILERISARITDPLRQFIPQIQDVSVRISEMARYRALRRSCEVVIDDGNPTPLERKGDGVKSLAAISLLRKPPQPGVASILALEEPESHLHPSAIHRLKDVIEEISSDHQVVITTHCPLFVDRGDIASNILIAGNKARPAKTINEIREVLGVKASDNLMHARLVLIVEGNNDQVAMIALLAYLSTKLESEIKDGSLFIDCIHGASNLSYKLSTYQAAMCMTHVFADNDAAGISAIDKAESDGILKTSEYHLAICEGMSESELEDCFNVELYENSILEDYGVNLNVPSFRGNDKWSLRMKRTFLSQGKMWNEATEGRVKNTVAECAGVDPANALNEHKRSSIDALVASLENKFK